MEKLNNNINELAEQIKIYLESKNKYYMDIFLRMVVINTFTENTDGVNFAGDFVSKIFKNLGFEVQKAQSINQKFGKHIVLSKSGTTDFTIGCVSHLDTVYTFDEEQRNDFTWRVKGDKIYGPGTIDIKGGTLVMLMMIDVLNELAPEIFNKINWELLFDASEEIDSEDFGELCNKRLGDDARACFIFESGKLIGKDFHLVTSRKGRGIVKIKTYGKGAHSGSNHQDGANAIVQLAEIIQKINSLTDYENEVTVNIGKINGGVLVNRVPHEAEALVEIRAFSDEKYNAILEEIKKLEEFSTVKNHNDNYSCKTKIEIIKSIGPWDENSKTDELFSYFKKSAEVMGMNVLPEKRGGLSDGNFIWNNVPTIDGLGPSGYNAHCSEMDPSQNKEQEYAEKSSIIPKAILNALTVINLFNEKNS